MKRDMDLIRDLLLYIENNDSGNYPEVSAESIGSESSQESILYNYRLLEKAGYVENGVSTFSSTGAGSLTWAGHDFVDSVRDPEIWRETKDVASKAGRWSIDLLGELAKGLIKTKIEKHTGVEL